MRIALLLLAGCAYGQVGHINCGGAGYTDSLSQFWAKDNSFTGGATSTGPIIPGTPDYFGTKRYGDFSYLLAVPDGQYTIGLSFLETLQMAPGGRVFSVTINGVPALTNYDIVADVGMNTITRKTFPATAAGHGIKIQFITVARSALVNAIDFTLLPSTMPVNPVTVLTLLEQCSGSGQAIQDPTTPAWVAATTYDLKAYVNYGSGVFMSLQASNTGHQPDIWPDWWKQPTWDCANMLRATITRTDGTQLIMTGLSGAATGSGIWTPIK